ncbi:NAD-dependent epimerase/dehydratase family protein [Amycolatopsis vancoresmycina]|uniref:NAD-dependent epimerase/dehydratase family protein n=1 Tax=Amycolatopsis vancoresmycina TaxID=208444 RepID=UPI000525910A|nr:NAD(P)-dependent oxidoreductase [Amycolatopsis vancoresmycina]
MKVLVAGATGVVGRRVVPPLVAAGHEVLALARPGRARRVAPGAEVLVADALDRDGVRAAVRQAAPDTVVNLLTAIPAEPDPKHLARDLAVTNRLRTEGTRNLLAAAGDARVISQGLAYGYQPDAGPAGEDAPLWRAGPPPQFVPVLAALMELERLTTRAGGLVLRLGHLYGPGTTFAGDGRFTRQVRAGRVPLAGGGHAVFSFTHADDAAAAVTAAVDRDVVTGVLNIVDDEPAPVHDWLPDLARLLGAPAPRKVPAAVARLAVGSWGVAFLNRLRGADNARARLRLGWRPRFSSVAEGFAAEFGTGVGRAYSQSG